MIASLLNDITPNNTTVYLEDNGAISMFSTEGGLVFIDGGDFFEYTGVTDNYFTGVSNLSQPHDAETRVFPNYGYTIRGLIAPVELSTSIDSTGITSTIVDLLDEGFADLKSVYKHIYACTHPLFCDAAQLPYISKSIGVEVVTDRPEMAQRLLALGGAEILKSRGTVSSFSYITYLLTGYETDVDLLLRRPSFIMNTPFGFFFDSVDELAVDSRTAGLWRLASGVGLSDPNEVSGEAVMTISDAAMWTTTQGCSMFDKDSILEFVDLTTFVTISHARGERLYLKSKSDYCIELLMTFDDSGTYPQTILERQDTVTLTREDAETLSLTIPTESGSETITLSDAITDTLEKYIFIRVSRDLVSVIVDGTTLCYNTGLNAIITTTANDWQIGGLGVNAFVGSLDMLRISDSTRYETEAFSYFDVIAKGRTIDDAVTTNLDEYTYMYCDTVKNGCLQVQIVNDDGEEQKHELVEYLAEEYLGAGCTEILPGGQLPLEMSIGFA